MQIPTWEQFSAVFAAPGDEQARAVREAFIQQHEELYGYEASSTEDYATVLISVYGYFLDFKEGTFSVVEWLDDKLGDAFTIDFDDEGETVKVCFGGKEIVLPHHPMGTDEFEQDLAQLERLMEERYCFIYQCIGEGASDTMELLLVPTDHWRRAETIYGQTCVAAHFRRCVSEEPFAPQVKAPSSSTGVGPAASRHTSEGSEWNTFYRLRANMFLWLILPVIVIFALSVLWGVLKGNTLQSPQPKGCENVDNVFRNLPAEQAAPWCSSRRSLPAAAPSHHPARGTTTKRSAPFHPVSKMGVCIEPYAVSSRGSCRLIRSQQTAVITSFRLVGETASTAEPPSGARGCSSAR